MDFIEGLPLAHGFNSILVVIDKFSKYGHFIPPRHPYTSQHIAQLFVDNVYKLHGLPEVIISDRDKVFTSHFWQHLFKLTDTTLNMSSARHPETDGQTERLNQCLETYLRCFVHSCPTKWHHWIPLAEFWYNTSYHSALRTTPFMVLYGHPPRQLGITAASATSVSKLDVWLQERANMNIVIQNHLLRAQQRMKLQVDKGRLEREYAVGDQVYLKLQPYVQMTVAHRTNQNLSFKYFGPFRIVQRIGKVAYKLLLPAGSKIHPVVHVSVLKRAIAPDTEVCSDLPDICMDTDHVAIPEAVLSRRLIKLGAGTLSQVLVKWHDFFDGLGANRCYRGRPCHDIHSHQR